MKITLIKLQMFFVMASTCLVNAQSITWKEKDLELITTTSKEKYESSFSYTNNSKKEVRFLKIKASCGCILVDTPKSVKPGETSKLVFKAPVPYGGGSYTKSISIDTDETDKVEYQLTFKITNTDPKVIRPLKNVTSTPMRQNKSTEPKPDIPKGYTRPKEMSKRALLVERLLGQQALRRKQSYHGQQECPFLPLKINKKLYHDFEGLRIYTCCEQCLVLVKQSPYHAIIKLSEKHQTPLPVKRAEGEKKK